jgi:hypothetical protein
MGTPIFMGEVPEYVVKGDHMHISWNEFEFVLPVSVMLACTATAEAAIAKWRLATLDNGSVVRFSQKR